MSNSFIVCTGLSFSWPDDTPVFDRLSFTVPGGRTGLVAPNGSGKSTLLKLIAGVLRPSAGTVVVDGSLGYLPQELPLTADRSVAEVLGIAEVRRALAAVESGDASEEHFTVIGSDWDIEDRTRAQLDRLGIGDLALDRSLSSLSGGQVVTLGLAAQVLARPDVLLLDEPTNNLDGAARQRLYSILDNWPGCLLVVSHDRALLDRLDRIAELRDSEIRFHGGNFTAYEEAVKADRDATERKIRQAEQEVKREKREMQKARERAARRQSNATRNLDNAGLPKIFAGTMKRSAQESAGKADNTHAARVSAAKARLDEVELAQLDDQRISLTLPQTTVPAGRTLFRGDGLRMRRGHQELFGAEGVDLDIRGPRRIALTGANGVGKSTLLRIVHGDLEPDAGRILRAAGRSAYLSQRLDLLDDGRTVAENLADAAPGMPESDRMNLLARFLFRGPRVKLPIGALSGGERLRATLACILFAEPAPQLLLLDEPTNNLDLVSAGQLESALNEFRGGVVVVSHDQRFLDAIEIDGTLLLDGGQLTEVADPQTSAGVAH
ncbi:MAG: ABC-F family ATP-binding cassette domain-containing protein [Pseudonocardia sp.]|uniref:ABC-F family ATP-binding cassette domain-containing protein n=1 Tax=unclassified Pseudonocardia TaxID=2619320 RepID=UPI00086BAB4D|nr:MULTISPECIES: ABC-F family ATP-binding cassette domain-containing protein [unclassified Pseudonocardia]MBN9112176.1 ABC-F family ATP-binding cassette domain-containing protein [Pseudonocardia sp.]ODU30117.1 MAG: ABC transporter [Pseudonocardia sp. SCN 72-51]ODV03041.1 MAG: ABC transporter [Pseudonocardia sp. SCN 73-27]